MPPTSVLEYLSKSLKLKIAKRLCKKLCKNRISANSSNDNTISISLLFDKIHTDSAEDLPDISEEGPIMLPSWNTPSDFLDEKSIIDILLVDDIAFNLAVLKRQLESLHLHCPCKGLHRQFTVHCAGSGKEAIDMICRQDKLRGGYRMIFMDCLMPEMDGWETTIAIRSLYNSGAIKLLPYIIAYSAFDSKDDIDKSHGSGMCDHISKPCTQEDLCKSVNQWVNRTFSLH